MKMITTLIAAVALVAGVSLANAAGTSSMGKSTTMDKSSMSKSARVIGSKKYCMKTKMGTLNCKFASLSACKKGSKGAACTTNPHISTTGSGSSMKK